MMLPQHGTRLCSVPDVQHFRHNCQRQISRGECANASRIINNVPIYELPPYRDLSPHKHEEYMTEWYDVLLSGPGVFVLENMYRDLNLIDDVSEAYKDIIEEEKRSSAARGDHFAAGGKNDRIWNSFSKHALTSPESFVKYYSNPYLAMVCESWLGPKYRVTAQVNNVRPGGSPQQCHRDYHMGFQSDAVAARFPRALHLASQLLTLQGAVAHVDVPVDSGPTRLLPFSQTFEDGYLAYRRPEYREYFDRNYVSLPLKKGDGIFFNPALFHAAGENQSQDVHRMVNLLQISSAFGKPMEKVDTIPILDRCWEAMLDFADRRHAEDAEMKAMIAAVGEGNPFPTNLDKNSPDLGQMTPDSEQDVIGRCLAARRSREEVVNQLKAMAAKSVP